MTFNEKGIEVPDYITSGQYSALWALSSNGLLNANWARALLRLNRGYSGCLAK